MSFLPVLKIGFWNAWLFMIVFLLQMLVMMFADKHIMEKSHVPKESRKNKMERYVGILGNLVWMITMVYSIFLPLRWGTLWFYSGFFVFFIGLVLIIASTFAFITSPAEKMISKGVYRFSRHPMYVATFFITLGSGISSASWLFILLSVILGLGLNREAHIEERFCLDKYGNVYRQYLSQVPRWFGKRRSHGN